MNGSEAKAVTLRDVAPATPGSSPGAPFSADYLRSDAGHPLGHGYPSGAPLREDGESHRHAWMRITRLDPCAYCGRAGPAGTVDHVDATGARGNRLRSDLHTWSNYAAACGPCNTSKRVEPLLLWLVRRTVLAPPVV